MNSLVSIHGAISEPRAFDHKLCTRWMSYIDASPKTIEIYSRNIKHFLIYMADKEIKNPQREDIVAYRDYLKQKYKPATVQGYLIAVKLFFKWTQQEGLYPDVAQRVKSVKLDTGHKKDYLTTQQVSKLLNTIDRSSLRGLRDYALLILMITTGLREISVIRADVEDMRPAGDSAALYHRGKGRSDKTEYVKIAAPVEEAIRHYLNTRGDYTPSAPLFCSISNRNGGGRLTTRSISRIAKTRLFEADLRSNRLTAHSLRHTAATLNLLNGGTVEETQQLLGHRNINTTMIYAHAMERVNNNSEERIARAIFS